MTVTRFPNGITNIEKSAPLSEMIVPFPMTTSQLWDDFNTFHGNASGTDDGSDSDWIVALALGGGSAASFTRALVSGFGGVLQTITESGGSDGAKQTHVQHRNKGFELKNSKQAWFECAFSVASAGGSDVPAFQIGLQDANTSFTSAASGLFFDRAGAKAGPREIEFKVRKPSTTTTVANVATFADSTFLRLGFMWNGIDKITLFLNGKNVPLAVSLDNLPLNTLLRPIFSIGTPTDGNLQPDINLDYFFVATER